LLEGHYVYLLVPDHPPISSPLPGYPLFLATFVKVFAPHWSWMKITSLVLTLLSSFLIWKLFKGWLPPWVCLIQVVIYAFNPTTMFYSRTVMSEPLFVFVTLLIFAGLRKLVDCESGKTAWILGLLLGWASLIRPQGVVLIPSVAMGLAYARRWPGLRRVLVVSLAIWTAVLARNFHLTHSLTGYSRVWLPELHYLSSHQGAWARRYGTVAETIIMKNFLNLDWFDLQRIVWLKLALCAMGSFLIISGIFSFSVRPGIPPAVVLAMYMFCFLYGLVHSLWDVVDSRYFLPLMPFVVAFLLEGLAFLSRKFSVRPTLWLCLGSCLIGWYLICDVFLVYRTHANARPRTDDLPAMTLRWIEDNTTPKSLFVTNKNSVVYLYTGRYAFSVIDMPEDEDKETFRRSLILNKINFIMFLVEPLAEEKLGRQWEKIQRWVSSTPKAFQCVYGNPHEGTTIFRILQNP